MAGVVKDNEEKENEECNKIFSELHVPLGFISK